MPILHVAIDKPIRQLFDYLPPNNTDNKAIQAGMRINVPFGKHKEMVGIIVKIDHHSHLPSTKLKRANYLIDTTSTLSTNMMTLLLWASGYYHHALGEVMFTSLPLTYRRNKPVTDESYWQLTQAGQTALSQLSAQAYKQRAILDYCQSMGVASSTEIKTAINNATTTLKTITKKGWLTPTTIPITKTTIRQTSLNLNHEQQNAVQQITKNLNLHHIYLLDGITGSGKTEVYISLITKTINAGLQTLVLIPEIGLTPQLIQRFRAIFHTKIAVFHSGLSANERQQSWQSAKNGQATILLGTRSAVWLPLKRPGLYIIDEEHDLSYKQQDGFKYCARDILIVRGKHDNVPVVLGSATPALESIHNTNINKYTHLTLRQRAGNATPPNYLLLDIRAKAMVGPLSHLLLDKIKATIAAKQQALIFLNRRGYAIHVICHECAWKMICNRCDKPYTYHKSLDKLICHHCSSHKTNIKNCPSCGKELNLFGYGTERIEEILKAECPNANIVRIDRDTTRKKNALNDILDAIHHNQAQIIIGTQMIAKGHHFPNITLSAIVDTDNNLFSSEFRATERMAQLLLQVSGRTGRGNKSGLVVIQTHYPDHPILNDLITNGYTSFSNMILSERKKYQLPPYSHLALLRAEASHIKHAEMFLHDAKQQFITYNQQLVHLLGPTPALLEKIGGRYRMQLLLRAIQRIDLHRHLDHWLSTIKNLKSSHKVRWSLDIDPQEIL